MITILTKKQRWGEKGLFRLTTSRWCYTPLKEVKVGTWRQELKQIQWRNVAYWLAFLGLLNYRSSIVLANMPRVVFSHGGLGAPASIRGQENVLQLCLQANQMESISELRFSLTQMSPVWAKWQKLTSTHSSGASAEDRRIKWLRKFIMGWII